MHAETPQELPKLFPNIDKAQLLAVLDLEDQTFVVDATTLYLRFSATEKELLDDHVLILCRLVERRVRQSIHRVATNL